MSVIPSLANPSYSITSLPPPLPLINLFRSQEEASMFKTVYAIYFLRVSYFEVQYFIGYPYGVLWLGFNP